MKVPKNGEELVRWTREIIDRCTVSTESRRLAARTWRNLFYMGSTTGVPSKYNRCYSHVDKLSSYIFSPADVRFTIEFEGDGSAKWDDKTRSATRYLNRAFNRSGCGQAFGQANEIALVEGASIIKQTWGPGGRLEPWVIRPAFFGVYREDIPSLDRQEAFTHTFYVTEEGFKRLVAFHPDRAELVFRASVSATPASVSDLTTDSYFHEIVSGAMQPIAYSGQPGSPSTAYGAVSVTSPPTPQLAPEVASRLIRIDDLWVWNDDLSDWTTIRFAEPGIIIEGRFRQRNLSDIEGSHPFVRVCSNEMPGYFWGRSELALLFQPQASLTMVTNTIEAIFRLRANPPRSYSGFQSMTPEKARAMLSPGGSITEQAIGAKVDNLAPEMPAEALAYLDKLEDIFDDVAGFTNLLSGEGEPGVRAGVHAGVLLRTSTPRIRDRALATEYQCGDFGTKTLKMLQTKDPTVIGGEGSFMLKQLPRDAIATVDSHTSSPAFVEDNRQLALTLAKAEAIDGETLIEMLHPPREDVLKDRLRQRQAAQAKFLAEHPEAAEDAKKKK